MTRTEPRPLSAPRPSGDPIEVAFVREQAQFWRAMRGTIFQLTHVLIPACSVCASPHVHFLHSEQAYVCDECGKCSAPEVAGRLGLR